MNTNAILYTFRNLVTLGEKLAKLRIGKFLTRSQLSSLTGIKENTLRSWEQNKRLPTRDNLIKVIKVFEDLGTKIDIDWFYKNPHAFEEGSPNIIYEEKIYKCAYQEAKKKLDISKNRYSLEEVLLEIRQQYRKIFLSLNREEE